MKYGYARVSSVDQKEDRQVNLLEEMNIEKKYIYLDKISGKNFDRPQYKKLINTLNKDDLLYITSIDRLGRNYKEILNEWRYLTKDKEIDIVVLDMPLLDTRNGKDLLGTFIADLTLQILSFVAESERVNIKERQRQGIEAAKKRGVKFGRPMVQKPINYDEIFIDYKYHKISCREAAKICGVCHKTFLKWYKENGD